METDYNRLHRLEEESREYYTVNRVRFPPTSIQGLEARGDWAQRDRQVEIEKLRRKIRDRLRDNS